MRKMWHSTSSIILQSIYWTAFCSVSSFAAVFLLRLSFSSSSIGLLVAAASLMAVFLQPAIGHWVDSGLSLRGSSRLKRVSLNSVLVAGISSVGIVLFGNYKILVVLLFFVELVATIILQPLFNALILRQGEGGQKVNYGVSRAFGSLCFAIGSAIIGILIERHSPGVLPLISTLLIAVLIGVVAAFPEGDVSGEAEHHHEKARSTGFGFIRHYPGFLIILIGLSFVFVFHSMSVVFLVNIIKASRGTESQLGYALMLMAGVEIPVMIGSNALMRKFGIKRLFTFAMIFYAIRSYALLLAHSMAGIYSAQLLQAFSFAIYIPVSVAFINSWMKSADQVKGQTMIVSATTLGSVAGAVFGGLIIDGFGVSAMLLSGSISVTIGAGLVIRGLKVKSLSS